MNHFLKQSLIIFNVDLRIYFYLFWLEHNKRFLGHIVTAQQVDHC